MESKRVALWVADPLLQVVFSHQAGDSPPVWTGKCLGWASAGVGVASTHGLWGVEYTPAEAMAAALTLQWGIKLGGWSRRPPSS